MSMTKQLKWWRDLTKEQRTETMKSNNIEAVTFEEIKKLYLNEILKTKNLSKINS